MNDYELLGSKEVKNPQLVERIRAFKKDSSEKSILLVLSELVSSRLILPADGDIKTRLLFHALSRSDGNVYQVVYSDSEAFNRAFGDKRQNGVVATFFDLADLLLVEDSRVNGFVLNPGSDDLVMDTQMIRGVVNQLKEEGVDVDKVISSKTLSAGIDSKTNVKVGDPEYLPEGMGNATIEFCSSHEEIVRVFIQLMQIDGEDKPQWLFIIEHNSDSEELFKQLGEAIGEYLAGLDIAMVDYITPFGLQVARDKIPVYAR